ncbi:acyl-CoA/acyl-ACP dehydrogenase [Desulfococcaceae bacterium OttesenSCG-928-F15]|nr:acyl-CoA/acyl-ACP dehydrogenase [Desulfococcaceae bacterium OttesenSCG-928-F15]
MNFDFSKEHLELTEAIKNALKKTSGVEKLLSAQNPQEVKRELLNKIGKLVESGYLKLGTGTSFTDCNVTAVLEVAAQYGPDFFIPMEMSTRLFGRILWNYGTSSQKKTCLEPIQKGLLIGAVALSEKNLSIENAPLACRGEKKGDSVKVTGEKNFVVNGPFADCFAVVGEMDGRSAIFLIPENTEGLIRGEAFPAAGQSGVLLSSITCHGCLIPMDQVIIPEKPEQMIATLRLWENQILSASAIGNMLASFSRARDFAKTHKSGGRSIISYQEISFKLASMYTLIQAARMIAYCASSYLEAKDPAAITQMHCAKVFCAESAEKLSSEAMQIMGAHAWNGDHEAALSYWGAKYTQIAGTSTELARVHIGDALLGKGN